MDIVGVANEPSARAAGGRHARRVPRPASRGGRGAKARAGRVLGVVTLAAAVGCVGPNARGSVAMKIDDRTAHVTLGSTEVEVGEVRLVLRDKEVQEEEVTEGMMPLVKLVLMV